MFEIIFNSKTYYEFAQAFFINGSYLERNVEIVSDERKFITNDENIKNLLNLLSSKNLGILPYEASREVRWIITGKNKYEVDQSVEKLRNFIVPTYGIFTDNRTYFQYHHFDDDSNIPIHKYGKQLFDGYYSWSSPRNTFRIVLNRIVKWLNLREKIPPIIEEEFPTYRELFSKYNSALAIADWDTAAYCIEELKRMNLTSAINIKFLEVELQAQTKQWANIWKRKDFASLAKIHVPPQVKSSLITAFHFEKLNSLEHLGNWKEAFGVYKSERLILGKLLETRSNLIEKPVLHVFAYQAVLEENQNLINTYLSLAQEEETVSNIKHIASLIGKEKKESIDKPRDILKKVFILNDFDSAWDLVYEFDNKEERVPLFVSIAAQTRNIYKAQKALKAYRELSKESKDRLSSLISFNRNLESVKDISDFGSLGKISSLSEWFDLYGENPDEPGLDEQLEELIFRINEILWDESEIQNLLESLLKLIVTKQHLQKRALFQTAINAIMNFLLQDKQFPRSNIAYRDIYDAIYEIIIHIKDVNEENSKKLFLLASAILENRPAIVDSIANDFVDWFKTPRPILEDQILEAFELLAEYGVSPEILINCFENWVLHRLSLPIEWDRLNRKIWLSFAGWLKPNPQLIIRIKESLHEKEEPVASDPIAVLPDNFRIGIFSLRKKSATRAKEIILERNPNLDIRICDEKVMSDTVEAIAKNSDVVILVTSAMKHSITYGIGNLLEQDPVYSKSSGTTSIIRGLENYLTNTSMYG